MDFSPFIAKRGNEKKAFYIQFILGINRRSVIHELYAVERERKIFASGGIRQFSPAEFE